MDQVYYFLGFNYGELGDRKESIKYFSEIVKRFPSSPFISEAYREIADDDLFALQWVKVDLPPEEFPGYKGERVVCEACGEGINFRREVRTEKQVLCRACAGERYYEPI